MAKRKQRKSTRSHKTSTKTKALKSQSAITTPKIPATPASRKSQDAGLTDVITKAKASGRYLVFTFYEQGGRFYWNWTRQNFREVAKARQKTWELLSTTIR